MTKCSFDLPSMEEIVKQIEECKSLARKTALEFKLITKKSLDEDIFACELMPYTQKITKKSKMIQNTVPITVTTQLKQSDSNGICLKNFAEKTEIEETSPYIELHFENQTHRTERLAKT